MIRAIIDKGWLKPLDPLPDSLHEGQEIGVDIVDDDKDLTPEEMDEWLRQCNELAAQGDPAEDAALMAELDRLRAEQKEIMRRRMGLSYSAFTYSTPIISALPLARYLGFASGFI